MSKPKTYFIDIDGTLFWHHEAGASRQWYDENLKLIDGVSETLDMLEAAGHHIVLVTARPERFRLFTERLLANKKIVYHQLVMGITSGERIIVNDVKPGTAQSCSAVTVPRNGGIACL